MKKVLCSILCAAMLLTLLPTALAAGTSGGLAAFTDQKQSADGIFTDVASGAWYAGSIATVYTKGIMDGMDGGRFDPDRTIPWSQAVTIAARLHAAYRGKDIPAAADGLWYVPYLDYARDNGLLPAICPADEDTNTTPITREGMAVLFRSVLDEQDLPAINDQTIPDLNDVRAEYRDAVSEMFASGIFTGIDGKFVPDGQATRAQVATIITRLLCPGQRVSHDARQNPYMLDQMGNLYNGGLCTRLGDTVYYQYTEPRKNDQGGYSDHHSILARSDSGQVRQVYACPGDESIEQLSVGPDGLLYFVQRTYQSFDDQWAVLKQLDPKTGAAKDIYQTAKKELIGRYLFYDNELYVYEYFSNDRIGRVANGKMTTLVTIPSGWEDMYVDDTMYFFGGKLCWFQIAPRDSKADDHLMLLDLKTGKTESIATKAHEFAYQGATIWSTEYTDGDYPQVLKRRSLLMPELTETVRVLDGEFAQYYDNLYANGSQLYYQVRNARKLWKFSSSGEAEEIATARAQYFEASAVTSQGTALMWNDAITSFSSANTDFILPDGQRTRLPAILNKPYFLEGKDQLTAADNQTTWEPTDDGDTLSNDITRGYVTPDGDVVLEGEFTNLQSDRLFVGYATIKMSGAITGEACFYISTYLEEGESAEFTFIFPKETVEGTGSMDDVDINLVVTFHK